VDDVEESEVVSGALHRTWTWSLCLEEKECYEQRAAYKAWPKKASVTLSQIADDAEILATTLQISLDHPIQATCTFTLGHDAVDAVPSAVPLT
jgi:hypothetical protein